MSDDRLQQGPEGEEKDETAEGAGGGTAEEQAAADAANVVNEEAESVHSDLQSQFDASGTLSEGGDYGEINFGDQVNDQVQGGSGTESSPPETGVGAKPEEDFSSTQDPTAESETEDGGQDTISNEDDIDIPDMNDEDRVDVLRTEEDVIKERRGLLKRVEDELSHMAGDAVRLSCEDDILLRLAENDLTNLLDAVWSLEQQYKSAMPGRQIHLEASEEEDEQPLNLVGDIVIHIGDTEGQMVAKIKRVIEEGDRDNAPAGCLSVFDAARELKVTPDELNEMRLRGEIHGVRHNDRWFFKEDEIKSFLDGDDIVILDDSDGEDENIDPDFAPDVSEEGAPLPEFTAQDTPQSGEPPEQAERPRPPRRRRVAPEDAAPPPPRNAPGAPPPGGPIPEPDKRGKWRKRLERVYWLNPAIWPIFGLRSENTDQTEWVGDVRKLTGRNDVKDVLAYPGARRVLSASAGGAGGYGLSALPAVKVASMLGASLPVIPLAASQAPLALPLVGKLWARRYEHVVQEEFRKSAWRYARLFGGDDEAVQNKIEEMEKNLRKWCKTKDEDLLDEEDEGLLVNAFNKSGVAHPEEVPYLVSRPRYARHCFTKMTELCETAREFKANPDAGKPSELRRLSDDEIDVLVRHALPSPGEALTNDQFNDRIVHLLQCSASYARSLENRHRKQRETLVTCTLIGSTTAFMLSTGTFVLPAVLGGTGLAARGVYRMARRRGQDLVMDNEGRITSGVYSPKTYKGAEIALCSQLDHCSKSEELDGDEKRWLPLIQVPNELSGKKFRSIDRMAVAAARPVVNALAQRKAFPKATDDKEKEIRKSKFDRENARLEKMIDREEELRIRLGKIPGELRNCEVNIALLRRKEERDGFLKDEDDRSLVSLESEKRSFESEERNIKAELVHLCGDDQATDEAGPRGRIEIQKDRVETAKQAYFEESEVTDTMEPDEIMNNLEIQRAFAVRVHEWFEAQKKGEGFWSRTGKLTGGAAKTVGGAVGARFVNAGAAAAASGVALGVITGGVAGVTGALPVVTSGLVVGGLTALGVGAGALIKGK